MTESETLTTSKPDAASASTPQVARLKGRFTPEAKQRINQFLQSFESFPPTLGLLYGDVYGAVAGRPSWSMTAYGPRSVADMVEMYATFGSVVLYELDGFQVIVPQLAHIAELDGGVLEFVGDRIRRAQANNG
jgi:hypothetical protein